MNQKKSDFFAEMAATRIAYRDASMHCPDPEPVPDTVLPLNPDTAPRAYVPAPRIENADALQAELTRMREQYRPFLMDLAPAVESTRTSRALDVFDWRMETADDRADFDRVLHGAADWTPVSIPHYGGPVGNHTAYYRHTFTVSPAERKPGRIFLKFKAVDYLAEVYLNKRLLGTHEGFFAPFEFEATPWLKEGENVLLVVVHNRAKPEKIYAATGMGWDEAGSGWHHCPPGMGIYQDVLLEGRPEVHVQDCFVRPLLDDEQAEAWIELRNCGDTPQFLALELSLYGQNFEATVIKELTWKPGCTFTVGFGDTFQEARAIQNGLLDKEIELPVEPALPNLFRIKLDVPQPRRWSNDTPWLYQLQIRLRDAQGHVVDAQTQSFGMRSFTMDTDREPKGRFYFNGREIRLRGANTMGYMQNDVARKDWDQLIDDILLAKISHMNFLRLTQRPVQPEIYDFCDRLGMMTQTDLPLFGTLPRGKIAEVIRQAGEMERLVRSHPCNIMISYINEPVPNSENKPHLFLERANMENVFRACDVVVRELNPDRVIKYADGDYDPPVSGYPDRHIYGLWYNGHGGEFGRMHRGYGEPIQRGWYYGCGEFGAEGLDPENVMRELYPKAWLPHSAEEDAEWTPLQIARAQSANFHYFFYDTPKSLAEWIASSQAWQAWAMGMQMRAFRRQNGMNSSAIHLFIDAWPAGWMKTIMDVKRQPKPAFFTYRDALTPLRVDLRTDRFQVSSGETMDMEAWIYNDQPEAPAHGQLVYSVSLEDRVIASGECEAHIPVCASKPQGVIRLCVPEISERASLNYRLALVDAAGRALHEVTWSVDVWPKPPAFQLRPLWTQETPGPLATDLLDRHDVSLIAEPVADAVLLFEGETGYRVYDAERETVDRIVSQGARALFLNLPPGTWDIHGEPVSVKRSSMNPLHFAMRNTGHRWVADYQPFDFRHWYDERVGYISPFLPSTFISASYDPVLASGNVNEVGEWGPALAVGERISGKGAYVIAQIELAHRTQTNPAAHRFMQRLLA